MNRISTVGVDVVYLVSPVMSRIKRDRKGLLCKVLLIWPFKWVDTDYIVEPDVFSIPRKIPNHIRFRNVLYLLNKFAVE